MRDRRWAAAAWVGLAAAIVIGACGMASGGEITARSAAVPATWETFAHISGPVDVVSSNTIVVAAAGRLRSVSAAGSVGAFASAYRSPGGGEPYIAVSPGGCFGRRTIYALQVVGRAGVTAIQPGDGADSRRSAPRDC